MYDLWKKIYETLIADSTLMSLLSNENDRVKRTFQKPPVKVPQIVYQIATPSGPLVHGTPKIEDLHIVVTCFAETDTAVANILTRVNDVLHDSDLTDTNIHSYFCEWLGWLSAYHFDEDANAQRRDSEFRIVVRRKT